MAATVADPRAALDAAIAKIEKSLGVKDLIHPASVAPDVYHLAFRSPHLNRATEGGAPWNRWMSLAGDQSTGKTYALYELYAMAQGLPDSMDGLLKERISYHHGLGHEEVAARLSRERDWIHDNFPDGAECAHYDIEAQFDPRRAQKVGVDTDRLYLVEMNVIEDVCYTLESLFPHFHLHGLDSTSEAESTTKLKSEPGKSDYGSDAKAWKEGIKHASTYFGPLKNQTGIPNMVVMVHQMSTNMRTGGSQMAVGKFLKFKSSCTVQFARGSFLYRHGGVLKSDKVKGAEDSAHAGQVEADGCEVFATIEKSRTCRPFRKAALQWDYRRLAYNEVHELASSGLYYGIIKKSGSWYSVDGENIGQGLKAVYEHLATDDGLRDKIMCRLLDYSDGQMASAPLIADS